MSLHNSWLHSFQNTEANQSKILPGVTCDELIFFPMGTTVENMLRLAYIRLDSSSAQ